MVQSAGELIAQPVQPLPRSVSSFIDRSLAVQPLNTNPGLRALPRVAAFPRARFVLWLAALTVMVGAMAASYLAYTASVSTSSYNLQRLTAEREAWRVKNDQLKVELARMRSLAFVEHEAVTRLGMQRPGQLIFLSVDEGARQTSRSDGRPPGPR